MEDVLIDIEQWLRAGASWAGPALAIAALLESLVVVGAVVPATPVLVAIGGVMAAGHAPPTLLAWAAAGAFGGNWTSFELGAAARRRNLRLPSRLGDQVGQVTEGLFARCGPGAIIAGRFLGPAASVAPFAAGWKRHAPLALPAGERHDLHTLAFGDGQSRLFRRRSDPGAVDRPYGWAAA